MTNRGTKLFFRWIKYCWRKRDERVAVNCSLFSVNFSAADNFFLGEKVLWVCRWDRYLDSNPAYGVWQKTCSRNMANAFYRLFAVRRFFAISPLFRCCSRIVYSGLFANRFFAVCCIQDLHRGSGLIDKHKVFFHWKKNCLPQKIDGEQRTVHSNTFVSFSPIIFYSAKK